MVLLAGCLEEDNSNKNIEVEEKFHCEDDLNCIDGEYCEVTAPSGCVNSYWWWKNVGNQYDCELRLCECINNRCEKK